ncbi:uncharacterized protein K489DRAFT_424594 [Dissoconium aciculare CBS 342.82]|uniref:Uncharacterized protein n=1 Tax=Dissoconium aciculare CBS 342.82 TaxID=1314786 RepID=A0A6J3M435_9PEZI|nr:uncharacterized protein K489DRAFT_424594 [Dissoconium aciculare CBS 342.82]KAF1822796.1 hypothetical protein K489DRAFT_424594 [Dissoconium aciculare CBS 342.82]
MHACIHMRSLLSKVVVSTPGQSINTCASSPPLCSGGFVGSRYHCQYCILWIRHIHDHDDRDDPSQVSRAHCGSTSPSPFTHVHPCRKNFQRSKPIEMSARTCTSGGDPPSSRRAVLVRVSLHEDYWTVEYMPAALESHHCTSETTVSLSGTAVYHLLYCPAHPLSSPRSRHRTRRPRKGGAPEAAPPNTAYCTRCIV